VRKTYSAHRNFEAKTDRIEKAVELISRKHVSPESEGAFAVYSQSDNGHYRVTLVSCECDDFHFNTDICKHQWASWGANAAQFVIRIRNSHTIGELEAWAAQFADLVCSVPDTFLAVVREEYRKRLGVIYQSTSKRRAS
jgi:hypothetical protein